MACNLTDVALHTLPAMAVAVACGFTTAFGLASPAWDVGFAVLPSWLVAALWIAPALAFLAVFVALWPRREQRQHGGLIPSRQSRLEAFAPLSFEEAQERCRIARVLAYVNVPGCP